MSTSLSECVQESRELCENPSAIMERFAIILTAGALAASGAFCRGAFAPGSQLFGRTTRFTGDSGALALTFDDGPNPRVTPGLLDLLDHHDAKATFFLIGRHVASAPVLAKEIAARGHVIGNHTQTHPNLAFCLPAATEKEVDQCDEAIQTAIGRKPLWMRPPFGCRSPALNGIVRRNGCAGLVMWSKWGRDWKSQPAAAVIHRLANARGGDILLLHDGDHRVPQGDRQHTVDALKHWIPRWKEAGLRFVTLDALAEQA
jgi:peptidoglycan/xylan/chitin deacetylase (PgdA/CDA1 family)